MFVVCTQRLPYSRGNGHTVWSRVLAPKGSVGEVVGARQGEGCRRLQHMRPWYVDRLSLLSL